MNRRSFLQRIGAAAVALTLARHLPGIAPEPIALAPPVEAEPMFKAGDVFTIEGHYDVNLPAVREFVVVQTADGLVMRPR